MEINNFKIGNRKDDIKILFMIIFIFFFIVWLLTPPGNKFVQVCFWGHNVQYVVTKIVDKNATEEYLFYWKNAVYLAQLKDRKAITEINKAIQKAPRYLSKEEINNLYRDEANINIIFKQYLDALNAYLKLKNFESSDYIKIAMLLKKQEKYPLAVSYCNKLFSYELAKEDGLACIADVYATAGKFNSSVKIYDYLINRNSNRAEYYMQRADYKRLTGDFIGQREDIRKAQELDPKISLEVADLGELLLSKNIKLSDFK